MKIDSESYKSGCLSAGSLRGGSENEERLTLSMLGKKFSSHFEKVLFFQKREFKISRKLSSYESVCRKCQSLFSGGKKKGKI